MDRCASFILSRGNKAPSERCENVLLKIAREDCASKRRLRNGYAACFEAVACPAG
jgi:hypothetical protein